MLAFLFSNANAQLITSSVTPIYLANTVLYVDSTGRILEPVVGWTSHHSICEFEGKGYLYFDNQHKRKTRRW
jgi:hypothetical protein